MLEVLVGVDQNDPLTSLSKFLKTPANYSAGLSKDALKVHPSLARHAFTNTLTLPSLVFSTEGSIVECVILIQLRVLKEGFSCRGLG